MAPEFATSLQAWIHREDDEPPKRNADGTLFVPTINQLMKPPVEELEVLVLSDKVVKVLPSPRKSAADKHEARVKEEVYSALMESHGREWVEENFERT